MNVLEYNTHTHDYIASTEKGILIIPEWLYKDVHSFLFQKEIEKYWDQYLKAWNDDRLDSIRALTPELIEQFSEDVTMVIKRVAFWNAYYPGIILVNSSIQDVQQTACRDFVL